MRTLLPRARTPLLCGALLAACTKTDTVPQKSTPNPSKAPEVAAAPIDLSARIAQFVPAELTADTSRLPESEVKALQKIIEAAKLLDPVFDRQAYANNPELESALEKDPSAEAKLKLAYFRIMRGPWDRQDENKPFAASRAIPKGAGFYPEDLSADELREYVKAHPAQKESLESLYTVVRREDGKLGALPYSQAYKDWLVPAAARLKEAAALTKNESLKKFLVQRADAFLSDDYYESDKSWMDLESLVEVTIGPYETYEDNLLGLKASFEAFVTISDPEASKQLGRYKELLPEMEENLPIPDDVKTKRGSESPIRVVDVVYTSGDARKSVQTIAFNLPNDERVRKEKGAKKVLLRNLIEKKFDLILRPIAERVIDESQLVYLSAEAFFNETLFHELSHSLGPAFTTKDGKKVEVRVALESSYSPLEEGKADVMGAYNILFMIDKGLFPKSFREQLLTSYFVGLFRSIRFGAEEAHGRGAAMQVNRFLEDGAAAFDDASGKFKIDLAKLEGSIRKLVHDLCILQHEGDKAGVDAFLGKYGVVSPPLKRAIGSLVGIPVDIRPSYPLAE